MVLIIVGLCGRMHPFQQLKRRFDTHTAKNAYLAKSTRSAGHLSPQSGPAVGKVEGCIVPEKCHGSACMQEDNALPLLEMTLSD